MFRTDNGRDIPSVITNVRNTKNGNKIIVFPGIWLNTIKNIANIINSKESNINPVRLELNAGIALWKYTFESIWVRLEMLCNAIDVLLAIKFHIINPKRRYIAKFRISGLNTDENTKYSTDSKTSGSSIDQKKPKTEFLYRFFRSPKAKTIINERFSRNAWR